jgi:hypothetical protein
MLATELPPVASSAASALTSAHTRDDYLTLPICGKCLCLPNSQAASPEPPYHLPTSSHHDFWHLPWKVEQSVEGAAKVAGLNSIHSQHGGKEQGHLDMASWLDYANIVCLNLP